MRVRYVAARALQLIPTSFWGTWGARFLVSTMHSAWFEFVKAFGPNDLKLGGAVRRLVDCCGKDPFISLLLFHSVAFAMPGPAAPRHPAAPAVPVPSIQTAHTVRAGHTLHRRLSKLWSLCWVPIIIRGLIRGLI